MLRKAQAKILKTKAIQLYKENANSGNKFLISDIAERLGVSQWTVRTWLKEAK